MMIYNILSNYFILLQLPLTLLIFDFCRTRTNLKPNFVLIISLIIFIVINFQWTSLVIIGLCFLNFISLNKIKLKTPLILFNLLFCLIYFHLNSCFDSLNFLFKTYFFSYKFTPPPALIFASLLITQLYTIVSINTHELKKFKFFEYIVTSTIPLVFPIIPIKTIDSYSIGKYTNKKIIYSKILLKGLSLITVALIGKIFLFNFLNYWSHEGIKTVISLNFVQSWLLFFCSSLEMLIMVLIYAVTFLGVNMMITGKDLLGNGKLDLSFILSEFYRNLFILKPLRKNYINIVLFIVILSIVFSLTYYQVLIILLCFISFLISKKWDNKTLKYTIRFIPILFFLSSLSINKYDDYAMMIKGMFNVTSLFDFYDEYYLLWGIKASIILTPMILISSLIYTNCLGSLQKLFMKLDNSYLILILFLILTSLNY